MLYAYYTELVRCLIWWCFVGYLLLLCKLLCLVVYGSAHFGWWLLCLGVWVVGFWVLVCLVGCVVFLCGFVACYLITCLLFSLLDSCLLILDVHLFSLVWFIYGWSLLVL